MSAPQLVVGTVRGRRGRDHLLVLQDGSRIEITFDGEPPRIGADVIGFLEAGERPRMRLVPDVARLLLSGRSLISPAGRPDLTARMLGRLLTGSAPAIIRPGVGGLIERTPSVEDPDLAWALEILGPVAQASGVALNVADPWALANAPWDEKRLRDELLPADTQGDGEALEAIKTLLSRGLAPACRRTLESLGRGTAVPSVDFIIPFSPFSTGLSWSRSVAGGRHAHVASDAVSTASARRLSGFREIALAFAPRYLGRLPADPVAAYHLEQGFADAAATLAFLTHGGDLEETLTFARLRESALARWRGAGSAPPATHVAVSAAVSFGTYLDKPDGDEILTSAAGIARNSVPRTAAALSKLARDSASDGVLCVLEDCDQAECARIEARFAEEMSEVCTRLGEGSPALTRLARLTPLFVPAGLEATFEEALERSGAPSEGPDDPDFALPFRGRMAAAPRL